MDTDFGLWLGLLLDFDGMHYDVLCVQNDNYPDQEHTKQRWTAHGEWKVVETKGMHTISVGSVYVYPGTITPRNFKFIVLEDEATCFEKYQAQNLVKIWIFEDNRQYPKPGVCFLASAAVELLEPMATVT